MGSLPEPNAIRVFVAGGAYAGVAAVVNLIDLSQGLTPRTNEGTYSFHDDLKAFDIEITMADERDGWYHLIGTPLALAESEFAKKNWVKYSDCAGLQLPNIKILHGSVTKIDPESKTATVSDHLTKETSTHKYDYFVAASGLRRVWPVVPQALTRKHYLLEAEKQIQSMSTAKHGVVVVGGGAVGIEMAAELKMVQPHLKVTLVHSRDKLLSNENLPDETRDAALMVLKEGGVEALMSHRLASTKEVKDTDGSVKYEIEFTNGHKISASEVVMAISKSTRTTNYLPDAVVDEEGYVKIKTNLNFEDSIPNSEYHFAAGDLIKWAGIKRAGAAMHQGHLSAENIHQHITQQRTGQAPDFRTINPVPPMIGLAVGKKAVAHNPSAGTTYGEDVAEAYFRGDLGWTICWNWLGLAGRFVHAEYPKKAEAPKSEL
ncbi:hypothetical protein EDB81DRAFT_878967 [Dactylonectria macrodidyma]|uniref:FAD/NAD(P)-binding domain-containing protein n=1 Tax=Dactylonectria macrodidyma TaxID=307937 RepID=A0A9P9FEZ1_9HYPO|nr:hypothetical protein EDB81DRAFT_878967 [Dactylonectria macrodidyma]